MQSKTDLVVTLILKALSGAEKSSHVLLRAKLKLAAGMLFTLAGMLGLVGVFLVLLSHYGAILACFVMAIGFGVIGGACLLWAAQDKSAKHAKGDIDKTALAAAFLRGFMAPLPPNDQGKPSSTTKET